MNDLMVGRFVFEECVSGQHRDCHNWLPATQQTLARFYNLPGEALENYDQDGAL